MKNLAKITITGLFLGVAAWALPPMINNQSSPPAHASWLDQPKNLGEAKNKASDIVLAKIIKIEKGPDLVVSVKGEPSGTDQVPTQRITLEIQERYKGDGPKKLVLFKTGGDEWHLEGDPPYNKGDSELLFFPSRTSRSNSC